MKVAILGTGYAQEHMRAYVAREDVEVVCVCARRLASAQRFARDHGIASATSSYEEALSVPGLAAISLATPPSTHLEITRAAVKRGLHVLCEKPLAVNAAEAAEMLALAEAANVVHATNFDYRVSPDVTRFHELLHDGFVGDLRHASIHWMGSYHADPQTPWSWRDDRSVAGPGLLGDLNHALDYLCWIFGDVDRIAADVQVIVRQRPDPDHGTPRPADADDVASFIAITAAGVPVTGQMSRCATEGGHAVIECFGSEGMLRMTMPDAVDRWTTALVGARRGQAGVQKLSNPTSRDQIVTTQDRFIETVKSRRTGNPEPGVLSSFREGVRAMRLVDALVASSAARAWVEVM